MKLGVDSSLNKIQASTQEIMGAWKHTKGACKYYISTLGVGGGSEGNAYFAYVVRGGGGSRGKMLILLM